MDRRQLTTLFLTSTGLCLIGLLAVTLFVFKKLDLSVETHTPESAPDLAKFYRPDEAGTKRFKARDILHATVNVPPERPNSRVQSLENTAPEAETPGTTTAEQALNANQEATPSSVDAATGADTANTTSPTENSTERHEEVPQKEAPKKPVAHKAPSRPTSAPIAEHRAEPSAEPPAPSTEDSAPAPATPEAPPVPDAN